jgi:hypothetical protein
MKPKRPRNTSGAAFLAQAVVRQLLKRSCLVVPNCYWTGNECDLLCITKDLRVIDVELKISATDLKADAQKGKWYETRPWRQDPPWGAARLRRRQWPARVWKHYYVLPAHIWNPLMLTHINDSSGVVLVDAGGRLSVVRRAVADTKAQRVSPADAVDIARLASLRMWDTALRLEAKEARDQR